MDGWKLNTYVHVVELNDAGSPTGRSASFGPVDDLPGWAVVSISNPGVWAEEGDRSRLPSLPSGKPKSDVNPAADHAQQAEVQKLRAELERIRAERDERLTLEESNRLAKMVDDLRVSVTPPGPTQATGEGPPPKGGAGSGAPAWRDYAASKGVEVSADASREDVLAALDAASVPTE